MIQTLIIHKSVIYGSGIFQCWYSICCILTIESVKIDQSAFKVEYYANENTLKILKKIEYVSERLMYPIIIIIKIPYHASFF